MAKTEEAPKIIFSMLGVSKKIERKEILRDISLSFYYGAKIGVLGLNGSGKSNILDSICFVLGISQLQRVSAASGAAPVAAHKGPHRRRNRASTRMSRHQPRSRRHELACPLPARAARRCV